MAAQLIITEVTANLLGALSTLYVVITTSAIDHLTLISEGDVAEVQTVICVITHDLNAVSVDLIDPIIGSKGSDAEMATASIFESIMTR